MAAETKPKAPNKITDVVHTLLDGLHSMSKSETIVGEPCKVGDATFVPVLRLRVALGAGSVHGGAKQDAASGDSVGLGAGGAVQIDPIAVIAVGRDGVPKIMCVETEDNAAAKLLENLPDLLSGGVKLLAERVGPLVGKLVSRNTASAIANVAKEALPSRSDD
jgi:uncharacterized spore protein YtfJ